MMKKQLVAGLATGLLTLGTSGAAQADIFFTFTESGGNVLMQSSGTLDTSNLVSQPSSSWGGVGVETNAAPESDIMGDTSMGGLDTAFGFHSGTDLSPWIGDMFTSSNFSWTSTGTTQFTTYYKKSGSRTPGIGISTDDMSDALWTPDVSWSKSGTFASLGLTEGEYTITDAVTSEAMTIQIGQPVPEPTSMLLFGTGLVALAGIRRKRSA